MDKIIKKTINHLKKDNKECVQETKEHNYLVKRLTDEPHYKRGKKWKRQKW